MSAPSRFTLMLEGSIEQIELVSSVRLNFDLKDTDKISTKIISIPSSIIRSGWPVNVYARIIITETSTEEPDKTISSLLSTEPFFSLNTSPSTSTAFTSNNLFIKESVSVGLDVEKLYFSVKEHGASYHDFNEKYWMILGMKRADLMAEVSSNQKYISSLYSDLSVNLNIDSIYCGIPVSNIPLIGLILMVIAAYFGIIRKYHLRLFSLK